MSNKYRKSPNNAILKDKGFIIVVVISLLMVLLAGYLAATWNQDPTTDGSSDNINSATEEYNGAGAEFDNSDTNIDVVKGDDGNNSDVMKPEDQVTATEPSTEASTTGAETTIVSYIWPCKGNVTNEYSGMSPVFSETLQDWRTHSAIDIQTEQAEDVIAAADGIVEDVYTDGLMGVSVLLKHADGMYTLYQSLEENPKILKNMEVKQGDVLGRTGNTADSEETEGTHLHFAMILNGSNCDPNSYIKAN